MAKLLFRLHNVSEDEANDVRQLLNEAQIEFYETDAGRWQISVAAIWLRQDEEYPRARALLDEYQAQRLVTQRAQHPHLPSLWQSLIARPVDAFFVLLAIGVIVGLLLWPFLKMIR